MELLDKKAIKELEAFLKQEIEAIVFSTRRDKPKFTGYKTVNKVKIPQYNGGNYIEDNSGKLRQSIRANKNFIKQTDKGIEIEFKMIDYFKYLDDERRDELNWYLTEAIFEDNNVRKKFKEIYQKSAKRVILKELKSQLK